MPSKKSQKRKSTIITLREKIVHEIETHPNKYKQGTNYDLRPLGLGVILYAKEGTGREKGLHSLRTVIQRAMHWDVIILAHGYTDVIADSNSKTGYRKIFLYQALDKIPIQKVVTLDGKEFTDAIPLIKHLYQQGFRKIWLGACNPGHVCPDAVFKELKGAVIRLGSRELYSESSAYSINLSALDGDEMLIESVQNLRDIEDDLTTWGETTDIHYAANDLANPYCKSVFNIEELYFIAETSSPNVWNRLKQLIRTVIKIVIGLFKEVMTMLINVLANGIIPISSKFESPKNHMLIEEMKAAQIVLENTKIHQLTGTSYAAIQKQYIKKMRAHCKMKLQ